MGKEDVDYHFLTTSFDNWWNEKFDRYYNLISDIEPRGIPLHLLERMGIDEEEFKHTYLRPWMDLDLSTTEEVLSVLTEYKHFYGVEPRHFTLQPAGKKLYHALFWTLVQVQDLGLKGLSFESDVLPDPICCGEDDKGLLIEPYRQCHFCGRLDTYLHQSGNKKIVKYCHVYDCPLDTSNRKYHKKGCCLREWKYLVEPSKHHWRYVLENIEDEEQREKIEGRIKKDFLVLCGRLLERNVALMNIEIRTREMAGKSMDTDFLQIKDKKHSLANDLKLNIENFLGIKEPEENWTF